MRRRIRCVCIVLWVPLIVLFFFFQAEDGIRDLTVTGVQTCALPISARAARLRAAGQAHGRGVHRGLHPRSEEHTSELQSQSNLVCRLLLEKKKNKSIYSYVNHNNTASHLLLSLHRVSIMLAVHIALI